MSILCNIYTKMRLLDRATYLELIGEKTTSLAPSVAEL
jgi:hypothetical protein